MNHIKSISCNLCGSPRYFLVYKKALEADGQKKASQGYTISEGDLPKPRKLVRCASCGLVYAFPGASFEQITEDYVDMVDHDYIREERGRREQARIILSRIGRFKSHGKLLDIGCGPGFFLHEARLRGWEVSGIDLSLWAKEYTKEHFGVDIFQGTLEAARFPDRTFDVIVLNDFIEHVTDPKGVLKEIRRVLKNDGVIYLSTPDIESVLSRVLGARWWGINKYHLFYFAGRTLEKLFAEVGFKSLRYSPYPRVFTFNYWTKRLKSYPFFIYKPFEFLSGLNHFGDRPLKIVLHDQIGVIARKVQRLDSVFQEDEAAEPPSREKLKVAAVLPAYNAEGTLEKTVADIPKDAVDEIILVDDKSGDKTVEIARKLGLTIFQHEKNIGYGANQKTCYDKAIERGADIVVMVHPDYQYDPKIIPQLIEPIRSGRADAVFGSRMMKGGALEGGMPLWKHNANILLTAFENVMLGTYLTEYHSGFRAYSARLLKQIPYKADSDGFVFDTEIIVQIIAGRFKIEEIPIRTRYFEEASTIRLWPSIVYGLGILWVMLSYFLHDRGIWKNKKFEPVSSS